MTFRPIYRALAPLAALAAALTLTAAAQAATPAGKATGTKIIVASTPFGPALAVGSGPFKNRTLYFISSDNPPSYGCTTGVTKTPFGPIACTGPSADRRAEWPAITTVGRPVAGPGVNARLLGTVHRKGVGTQVTYRGRPLYLFSFEFGPGQVVGEGFFEPGLPPWHGVWWLMSPRGFPRPWAGTLTTAKIGGKTVLAASYLTEPGWINFPLYTFSADKPGRAVCSANPACAGAWPPVITSGRPGSIGVSASGIGGLTIPGKLRQVTWKGHPLYTFAFEMLKLLRTGKPVPEGNGNGIKAFGGTFRLVANP
jgi:predicted lipoprotein with Yx(FWY)xxD motif